MTALMPATDLPPLFTSLNLLKAAMGWDEVISSLPLARFVTPIAPRLTAWLVKAGRYRVALPTNAPKLEKTCMVTDADVWPGLTR